MAIAPLVTHGFGSFSDIAHLVVHGYGIGTPAPDDAIDIDTGRPRRRKPIVDVSPDWEPVKGPRKRRKPEPEPAVSAEQASPTTAPAVDVIALAGLLGPAQAPLLIPPVDDGTAQAVAHYLRLLKEDEEILAMLLQ